nr:hypothetical protein [Brevibacillus laterosporus]
MTEVAEREYVKLVQVEQSRCSRTTYSVVNLMSSLFLRIVPACSYAM